MFLNNGTGQTKRRHLFLISSAIISHTSSLTTALKDAGFEMETFLLSESANELYIWSK